jgi:hypothetical protein
MKYLTIVLLLCALGSGLQAQTDTLQYDGITHIHDGKLIAATRFPGEVDVVFNARFTPAEKCTLHTVLLGFSVVKFQALTGNDTLIVYVYENGDVPPHLVSLEKTYKVNLGDAGFPSPNIRFDHPLEAAARDVLAVKLNPPVLFSPKRDFLVGVTMKSTQKYAIEGGLWHGLSLLFNPGVPEHDRYRRYSVTPEAEFATNMPAVGGNQAGLFIRAIVGYNPELPVIFPTDVKAMPASVVFALERNYPNPFNPVTTLTYTLDAPAHVRLAVHDALGREVALLADGSMDAGRHRVQFDAGNLPGGLYTARLSAQGRSQTRKMLLMK